MNHQVHRRWKIAAIALGLLAGAQAFHIYRVDSQLKNVFHYDVFVTVKDKETGAILESVTTHGASMSTTDLFYQSTTYSGDTKTRHLSGIAYEPREFGFSKEGYARKNVLITEATKRQLTVELERTKNGPNKSEMATPRKPSDQIGS